MEAARHSPLRLGTKISFASGQLIEGVVNNALSLFQLFYVTTACGLSGGLAGIALSAPLMLDAIADPLIGSVSDGWRSRYGRRLPFMALGLGPIALCLILVFTLPSGLGQAGLALWLALLTMVLRISMSLFVLPYGAVSAELSDDYVERSSIMSWRWGIGQAGALLVVFLGFGVFFAKGGLTHRAAYLPFAVVLAVVLTVGGLLALRATHAERARLHQVKTEGTPGLKVFVELAEIFRNPSFRVLFAGALLFFISIGVYAALAIHANTFFWHLTSGQILVVMLSLFIGLLAGAFMAGPLVARFEKAHILCAGMFCLGLAQSLPFLLRFAGVLTLTGQALMVLLALIMILAGSLMAAASIAFMAMMADAADEHEYLFGARREGLFFAGWSFATKAATGIGALVSGAVLQWIHFPTDLAQHGGLQVALPQTMTDHLAWFTGPGTGLLSILAALINLGYRLDRKKHAAILTFLASRKAKAA